MILSLKANARRKRRPFDKDVEVRSRHVRADLLRPAKSEVLEHWREKAQQAAAVRRRRERWALLVAVMITGLVLWMLLG